MTCLFPPFPNSCSLVQDSVHRNRASQIKVGHSKREVEPTRKEILVLIFLSPLREFFFVKKINKRDRTERKINSDSNIGQGVKGEDKSVRKS